MAPVNAIVEAFDAAFADIDVTSNHLDSEPDNAWFRVDAACPVWDDIPIDEIVTQQVHSISDYIIGRADGCPIVIHVPTGTGVSSAGKGHPGWHWKCDGKESVFTLWVEVV